MLHLFAEPGEFEGREDALDDAEEESGRAHVDGGESAAEGMGEYAVSTYSSRSLGARSAETAQRRPAAHSSMSGCMHLTATSLPLSLSTAR